ncbi:MAG TPA: cytochrome c biogenesis protein [Vicinamibacteria bacterium]|nr:cytochrome c biogenesis protein [Vicinamibacteria bacterium]
MRKQYSKALPYVCFVSMIGALYGAFVYAPTERTMGDVQRIFYFHVASWWVAFVAFAVTFGASILYLWKEERLFDDLALASTEVGVLFTTIGITMGPIWAKYAWGVYWTWDPRLTTALVLWLMYIGYLMLRRYVPDETKRAKLASVVAIIAFVDVPIVFMAIWLWRTQHPSPVIIESEGSGLHPQMRQALYMAFAAFSFLYLWLVQKRLAVEDTRHEVDRLHKELELV